MNFDYIEGLTEEQITELFDDIAENDNDNVVWTIKWTLQPCKKNGVVQTCTHWYDSAYYGFYYVENCFGFSGQAAWYEGTRICTAAGAEYCADVACR